MISRIEAAPVVFERKNPSEPALVIQVGCPPRVDNPKIRKILKPLGITGRQLKQLLTMEISGPKKEIKARGEKIEDAIVHTFESFLGDIEVSDCHLYKEVVTGENDTSFHWKGFEIIYGKYGSATLSFPEVTPIFPEIYGASAERSEFEIRFGTLAIIPAPTANGWSKVSPQFGFRYVCLPPWSSDLVAQAIDLPSKK